MWLNNISINTSPDQGLANIFCKGPDNKYLSLCRPHVACHVFFPFPWLPTALLPPPPTVLSSRAIENRPWPQVKPMGHSWYIRGISELQKQSFPPVLSQGTCIFHFLCSVCAVLSHLSGVQFFATPWTVTYQAPLSIGLSRQEYWHELLCPPPGDLPGPGNEPRSLMSPALAGGFFTISTTWEAHFLCSTWN